MKKFFSILCAIAIVFSANAAPVKKARAMKFAREYAKEVKAQKTLKAEKAAAFTAAQQTSTKAAPAKKQFTAQPTAAKAENVAFTKAPMSQKAAAAKVAKAKKEATDVTIGSWYVEDWGTDGELYLFAEDNKTVIYADLIYGDETEDLIPGKEYTVADVYVSELTGEQYAGVFYDGEWHYGVKELSVTKTIDEKGLVHFAGSVLDSLDAAFTFHYDETEFKPTGEVVEHAFTRSASISYLSFYGQWSVKASDAEFAFRMDFNEKDSESPVGTYLSDSADFDLDYTYVEVFNAAGDSSWQYQAVKAAAVIAESNDSILIAIDFICENGVEYKATAFVADPTAEEQADFVATDLDVDDSYFGWFGIVWIDAFNADGSISLTLYPESDDYTGDYLISQTDSLANASGSITIGKNEFDLFSGTFTVAKGANGYTVTGKVLATNNVEYALNISYVKPEPTRQAELTLSGLTLSFNFNAEVPWWQLAGYNADSTVMVTVSPFEATQFAGTYKGEDLDPAYTYIVTDITYDEYGDFDTYNYFKLVDADLTVTYNEADSTMNITGTYVGRNLTNRADVPAIAINFTGKIPTPEVSDLTFTFAENEDGITVTPSNDEDAWDWFVVNEATFEYYGADYIADAIYSQYGASYAVTGEQFLSFDEDIAYYTKDGGVFYLVVWGAGEQNVTTEAASYKFEVEEHQGGNEYDAQDEAFKVVFAEYSIEDKYFAQYGVLIVSAEDAEGHYISLEIETETATLAAGEYTVGEEVAAGELDMNEGAIYGSFAGNVTPQGISVPLWLIVDGTVTVYENGPIAVKATNTWGAQIECLLGQWPEAIDNTKANATVTKRVVNGQLIIEKNGVQYNVFGAEVK